MVCVVVVGVGMAGRVRIHDLGTPDRSGETQDLHIVGFVSRQELGEINGVRQISLEDALSSPEVQAVIICTENQRHEELVRRSLSAGKHVCVEYPLALSASTAQELFKLADTVGKVLHVEHIELLTSQYKMLKQQVAGREPQEGHLDFTGKPLCEKKSGFLAFSGVTRVTWFVDLFGELSVEKAMLETCPEQQNTKLTAHLLTANNKRLTWVEERGEGLMRSKQMRISFTDGSCMESLPQGPGGSEFLFMQDLSLFARKLRAGAPFPDSEHAERRRILHCLQLATDIQRHCMQLA
ncbi:biliverdin reductase A [Lampetra fluviatilis]